MLPALRLPGNRRGVGATRTVTAPRAIARFAIPVAAAVLLLATGLPHAQPDTESASDKLTGSSPHAKFNRQLAVFERLIDDILIDSEHALTTHDRNAQGAYLPGHGAVFTFDFSLVGPSMARSLALNGGHGVHWFSSDGDIDFFEYYDDDDDDDDDDDKDKNKDREKRDRERERRRRLDRIERLDRQGRWLDLDDEEVKTFRTRQYVKVKEELIDTLGEYGDLLDGLPADEWVSLVARPRDVAWGDRRVKRLVIRARMRDIADRAAERIDEGTFRQRLVIEEYK